VSQNKNYLLSNVRRVCPNTYEQRVPMNIFLILKISTNFRLYLWSTQPADRSPAKIIVDVRAKIQKMFECTCELCHCTWTIATGNRMS